MVITQITWMDEAYKETPGMLHGDKQKSMFTDVDFDLK